MAKKLILSALFLCTLLLISTVSFAKDTNDGIKTFHLNNGQTVIIKEVHNNPIVTIDTWVRTGSINENDSNNGVSHFLEHLLFKGTKTHKNGEIEKILESKGANFNAATSKDFTHFYITTASQYAETALDLHADMLLNATIPQDELDRERKVVQEEIRRAEDNPERILFKNLNDILFKSHPYKYETLGTAEIIGNVPRQEIMNYYHKWYNPANMTTVIVGDVNTNKMLNLVKEKFKFSGNKKQNTSISYKREPDLIKAVEKVEKGNYNTGYLDIAFRGVPIKDKKENYALDLAASILGDGTSSRLYQDIKEKQNLVTSISAGHYSMKDDSIFYVGADMKPSNYILTKEAIIKEIDRFKEGKVTAEELQRAKNQLQRQFLYESESVENIANSVGYSMTIGGNLDYYTNYINEINKITANDIQNAAKKYLVDSKMAVSALMPETTNVNSINQNQESYKNITKSVLNNGLTLISEKNSSNDIISLSVFVKGGKLIEPTPGITDLIAATLLKGTTTKTALEISTELENSGIIISPSANPDYFEIQLKTTKMDFDKAFGILTDIINNPAFKDDYITRAKADIAQSIQSTKDTPLSYAFEKFTRTIYPNHPYGNVGEVIEKNLPKISREDIFNFYKQTFVPKNMIISVSGDIDNTELAKKIYTNFPEKDGNIINLSSLTNKFQPLSKNLLTPVAKDSSAAWMLLGWPVNSINESKDYASLKIINSILGDGLSSRLFISLREKQGLAYAVSSAYPSRLDNSFFVLYIGTEPKNVETVKNGFLQEINKIKTEPISNKELDEAKQKLIGQFALSQETNQQKAHNLGWFESIGKGYKFNYTYPDLVNSVTAEDIIKTANKYFNSPYAISIVAPEKSIKGLEKEYNSESKR